MVTLVGQPVTVVAVAVAGPVCASGGVLDADGEGGGSVGDGEGDVLGSGVGGGADGEGVVSGHWGGTVCGPDLPVVARVLWMTGDVADVAAGGGGVLGAVVVRVVSVTVGCHGWCTG